MHTALPNDRWRTPARRLAALVVGAVAIGPALPAQVFLVSPNANYATSDGGGTTSVVGAYAAGRYQVADGNLRGIAMLLKSMAFRHDHRNYDVADGMGRAWRNVQVRLADGDLNRFGPTYAGNAASTPTTVLDGPIRWPIQLGVPQQVPASWDVVLPFARAYNYAGNRDLLADLTFSGGSLDNRAAWTGAQAHPYALDAFSVGPQALAQQVTLGRINGGCVDSASASPVGASVRLDVTTYGPNAANTTLRNTYAVAATGRGFARSAPALLVLAFEADLAGLSFPFVACNKFHLSTNKLWFFHPVTTDASGGIGPYHFGYPYGMQYTPLYHGINLVTQGAWPDSRTSGLRLSTAARSSLVTVPLATPNEARMKAAYGADPGASVATTTADGDGDHIPLIRYGR